MLLDKYGNNIAVVCPGCTHIRVVSGFLNNGLRVCDCGEVLAHGNYVCTETAYRLTDAGRGYMPHIKTTNTNWESWNAVMREFNDNEVVPRSRLIAVTKGHVHGDKAHAKRGSGSDAYIDYCVNSGWLREVA